MRFLAVLAVRNVSHVSLSLYNAATITQIVAKKLCDAKYFMQYLVLEATVTTVLHFPCFRIEQLDDWTSSSGGK